MSHRIESQRVTSILLLSTKSSCVRCHKHRAKKCDSQAHVSCTPCSDARVQCWSSIRGDARTPPNVEHLAQVVPPLYNAYAIATDTPFSQVEGDWPLKKIFDLTGRDAAAFYQHIADMEYKLLCFAHPTMSRARQPSFPGGDNPILRDYCAGRDANRLIVYPWEFVSLGVPARESSFRSARLPGADSQYGPSSTGPLPSSGSLLGSEHFDPGLNQRQPYSGSIFLHDSYYSSGTLPAGNHLPSYPASALGGQHQAIPMDRFDGSYSRLETRSLSGQPPIVQPHQSQYFPLGNPGASHGPATGSANQGGGYTQSGPFDFPPFHPH